MSHHVCPRKDGTEREQATHRAIEDTLIAGKPTASNTALGLIHLPEDFLQPGRCLLGPAHREKIFFVVSTGC